LKEQTLFDFSESESSPLESTLSGLGVGQAVEPS
jgi:hypothetical protein